jgi:hypothetical protein
VLLSWASYLSQSRGKKSIWFQKVNEFYTHTVA